MLPEISRDVLRRHPPYEATPINESPEGGHFASETLVSWLASARSGCPRGRGRRTRTPFPSRGEVTHPARQNWWERHGRWASATRDDNATRRRLGTSRGSAGERDVVIHALTPMVDSDGVNASSGRWSLPARCITTAGLIGSPYGRCTQDELAHPAIRRIEGDGRSPDASPSADPRAEPLPRITC